MRSALFPIPVQVIIEFAYYLMLNQRQIKDRRPLFENIFGYVIVHFDFKARIYFKCSQHAIYSICHMYFIFYSNYSNTRNVLRDIKIITRPKEFYRPWTVPLVLKFLDQPLIIYGSITSYFNLCKLSM